MVRGADGTPTSSHASGENVTLLTFGAVSGNDWDQVYNVLNDGDPNTTCKDLTGVTACTFDHDGRATSIFTQSKDYDEISGTSASWQWRDQSVPDADALDDGFAVRSGRSTVSRRCSSAPTGSRPTAPRTPGSGSSTRR